MNCRNVGSKFVHQNGSTKGPLCDRRHRRQKNIRSQWNQFRFNPASNICPYSISAANVLNVDFFCTFSVLQSVLAVRNIYLLPPPIQTARFLQLAFSGRMYQQRVVPVATLLYTSVGRANRSPPSPLVESRTAHSTSTVTKSTALSFSYELDFVIWTPLPPRWRLPHPTQAENGKGTDEWLRHPPLQQGCALWRISSSWGRNPPRAVQLVRWVKKTCLFGVQPYLDHLKLHGRVVCIVFVLRLMSNTRKSHHV